MSFDFRFMIENYKECVKGKTECVDMTTLRYKYNPICFLFGFHSQYKFTYDVPSRVPDTQKSLAMQEHGVSPMDNAKISVISTNG